MHEQTGEEYCRGVFNVFVERGELVGAGHRIRQRLTKVHRHQEHAVLNIFIAHTAQPMYVDEPGCRRLATVVLPMSDQHSQALTVEFTFGGTEVLIKGIETATGRAVVTTVEFQRSPAADLEY